jgi:signal transduction histidine kinase
MDLVFQRTHPDDVDALRQVIDRAEHDGADWSMQRRLLMPDGSVKSIQVVAHGTRDEAGNVEFVGAIMDVTQFKQAQDALHRARAELLHATRLTTMGELAATIAHEVKQPLSGMIIRAQTGVRWCNRGQPDMDKVKAAFERIAADGLRAGKVIESIRQNFKKDAQTTKTLLDVNDLIGETLAFAQGDLQQHRITVQAERTTVLPKIEGDRIQLQQVLLNLITNAIESMTTTQAPRVLRVSSELHHGGVAVSVEDTGSGISSQDVERVFEPLFTTKPNGMGMGLSICRSIVESHGGRLWASPRQPCGSVFRFTLPSDQANSFSTERADDAGRFDLPRAISRTAN